MGDCAYQVVRENINDRDCFTEIIHDLAEECRKKWIEKAEVVIIAYNGSHYELLYLLILKLILKTGEF